MKILMFGWEYPPFNSGGLGVACQGLSSALAQNGFDIIFVLPGKKLPIHVEGVDFVFADIDEKLHFMQQVSSYPSSLSEDPYTGQKIPVYGEDFIAKAEAYRLEGKRIAKELEGQFDVIHAHDWLSFGAGIAAKEVSGKPLISHLHSIEYYDRAGGTGRNEFAYSLENEGLQKADKIIAVSEYTKQLAMKEYNIKSQKVEVVHNGTDPQSTNCVSSHSLSALKQGNKKIVIWFGRLTIQKGVDYFIRAAERVLSFDKNVIFIIAGDGEMKPELIQYVSHNGLSENILFTEFLRGNDLQCLIDVADLYVMTSVSEPFGLVPLEVLQKDVPVIITKNSGVSEVLTYALKIDFWDIEEIANKILATLHNPVLHKTLRDGGKSESKRQTWKIAAEKCIALYKQLVPNLQNT
tara:strand:+ start:4417 stop:5637 length:1221 start_codon:yes stop_codon:yes gene_type:complete